ncbi:hypothetical protein BGZ95_009514 [Linnemannia exigua]|uniref:HCP-like protein n=1 Tax=Linnemannia exigua TaxID=604196 RepID=A0AAD4DCP9_9FUNG|nr:hypothetical protein BGZ95_009514 [Linnemannia exigua]
MTVQDTHSNIQAVRRVNENEQPACSTTPADPLRIAAVPGATLDIVVRGRLGEKELSLESLQVALPGAHQRKNHNNADPPCNSSAVATARRNPAGGHVEAAWDNLTHIDNPDAGPVRRGPQAMQDSQGASDDNKDSNSNINTSAKELKVSSNRISLARSPQESTSATAQDITEVMINARLGDMHAQNALGEMYKDGRGVHQDYEAAMDWYLKAADQGHAGAQSNIGRLYRYGHGVPLNYVAAMEWFLKSVDQGDATAQYNVGSLYRNGHGVSQDYPTAIDWYLRAADQGHAQAQNILGFMQQHGQGTPQDYSSAMDWYLKAADQGNAVAQSNIGHLYRNGYGVP